MPKVTPSSGLRMDSNWPQLLQPNAWLCQGHASLEEHHHHVHVV